MNRRDSCVGWISADETRCAVLVCHGRANNGIVAGKKAKSRVRLEILHTESGNVVYANERRSELLDEPARVTTKRKRPCLAKSYEGKAEKNVMVTAHVSCLLVAAGRRLWQAEALSLRKGTSGFRHTKNCIIHLVKRHQSRRSSQFRSMIGCHRLRRTFDETGVNGGIDQMT